MYFCKGCNVPVLHVLLLMQLKVQVQYNSDKIGEQVVEASSSAGSSTLLSGHIHANIVL